MAKKNNEANQREIELGEILKSMYTADGHVQDRSIFVFAMKYGKEITENNNIRPGKIIEKSGLTDTLTVELRRGLHLYEDLVSGDYGLTFADIFHSVTDDDEATSHPEYPQTNPSKSINDYLRAIKAKPFLILGGFSGTGKSQSVKELAYITCQDINGLQSDPQMPGNYCLVSVKPNWHDSSDLLGFYSSINDKYELTGFIRFLVKAMQNPSVPFFACIDEMNLAPVEEYFAEYLSVLESRSYNPATNQIESATLLEKDIFTKAYKEYNIFKDLGIEENSPVATLLKAQGLRLPQNVVVIGTVNMDDTTHSFSRKVIDRAMTFETNIIDFTPDVYDAGDNMHYVSDPKDAKDVLLPFASAKEALKKLEENGIDTRKLMEDVTGFVNSVNTALKGSPFQISYRVLNETILYYYSYGEGKEVEKIENVFNDILMMKVLPRIEGDQDKAKDALEGLLSKFDDAAYTESRNKITEMLKPFGDGGSGFTTFWN